MVEVKLNTGSTMTLSEFLTLSGGSLPISVFGSPTSASSVRKAVSFLVDIGGGAVIAKPSSKYNRLKIVVQDSAHVYFNYENYRQPLNNEARPYTDDSWSVGDFIINTEPGNSDAKIAGWVCIEGGIPGKWEPCYRYGATAASSDASSRKVISYRDRAGDLPDYGIVEEEEEVIEVPVTLDAEAYTGNTEISAVINGVEFDTSTLSSNRDDLSDGIIYVKVLEE
jgi:hypothetical protein